jgi:hypothetical protein
MAEAAVFDEIVVEESQSDEGFAESDGICNDTGIVSFNQYDSALEAFILEAGEFDRGACADRGGELFFFLEKFVEGFDKNLVGRVGFAAKF